MAIKESNEPLEPAKNGNQPWSEVRRLGASIRAVMFGSPVTNYGFTQIIREYAGLPRMIPFPAHMEHGWYLASAPREGDLRQRLAAMLVFNKRRALQWKRHSSVPVAVMGAPFVHYRRRASIKISPDAAGTVAFPGHSGTFVEAHFDIQKYSTQLHDLPSEFKPITVCLHWDDLRRGRGELFQRHGLAIATAGPRHDPSFPRRFYEILSSHRYATSNSLGTYILYAVELGVPFFLLGDRPRFVAPEGGSRVQFNELNADLIDRAEGLFSECSEITVAQRDFVVEEAGLEDCLSGPQLRAFLVQMLVFRALPLAPMRAVKILGRHLVAG